MASGASPISNVVTPKPGLVKPTGNAAYAGDQFLNPSTYAKGFVSPSLTGGVGSNPNVGYAPPQQNFSGNPAANAAFSNMTSTGSNPAPNLSTGPGTSTYAPPPVITPSSFAPANGSTGTSGAGSSGGSTGSSSDPYSTANYYAAHPDANPANNSAAANTYSGGVNGYGQTFPGYVSALGTMASKPSENFTAAQTTAAQAAQDLINSAPGQNTAVQQAEQQLKDLQDNYQNQTGLIGNSPIGLSEQGGEQGLLNNQYSGKLANAQGAVTNALAGNAQEQAAYTGAGNVANTTASGATTQQGTQQSGTATAAGLIAPQPGQNPATQTFNPQTGTYSGLAALSAGGTSGQSASQALENLGITLGAEGAGANLVPLQQALDAGQGAAQNVTSYLASNPSLNSSSFNVANFAAQWASGQYSGANSAQYQTLGDYLTTFATQMAPLLAPGGTSTDASRALQQSLINGSANGQTITQVLNQLTAEANTTLANLKSGGAGGGAVAGGTGTTSVAGGTNPPASTFSQNFFSST